MSTSKDLRKVSRDHLVIQPILSTHAFSHATISKLNFLILILGLIGHINIIFHDFEISTNCGYNFSILLSYGISKKSLI
jgi:hypothetical protein